MNIILVEEKRFLLLKNYRNNLYFGTLASGKPPAFGAGIPQVRILPSQYIYMVQLWCWLSCVICE